MAKHGFFAPFLQARGHHLGPILIYQTVSLGASVNKVLPKRGCRQSTIGFLA
jgi:hypothetical protein